MSSQQMSNDGITLVMVGILAGPALLAALATQIIPRITGFLIETHILLAPKEQPLVAIPGTGGAGLDPLRLTVLAAVGLIFLVWTVWLMVLISRRRTHIHEKGSQK